jgi:O-antigen ligase
VQFLSWNGKIYWMRKVPPSSSFGPFVNHNHFAGYVEMIIPLAVALALYVMEKRRRSPDQVSDHGARARQEERGRWGQSGLALFAAVVLVVALLFSQSRGGLLSTIASGVVLFALVWRRIASRALMRTVAIVLPVVVIALALWIGADVLDTQLESFRGLESEASFRSRALIWDSLVRHVDQFKWVGAGFGAFEPSFAPYTPAGSARRWDKAHNDYLQILWETGLVGVLLVLAALGVFVYRYWAPAMRSRPHRLDLFAVAISVSLMSIALHSLVDFNLQIGSNGFLCTVLAGLLIAVQKVSAREPAGRPTLVDSAAESP